MPRRLYWDFFGPRAQGTAEHYIVHLRDLIARQNLPGCEVDIETSEDGRVSAFCTCSGDAEAEALAKALRPRRIVRGIVRGT